MHTAIRKNEKSKREWRGKHRVGKRGDVGHFFSGEIRGGSQKQQTAAPNGFFLFCNEATSCAAAGACGVFQWGWVEGRTERRAEVGGDKWWKWVEVVKSRRDGGKGGERTIRCERNNRLLQVVVAFERNKWSEEQEERGGLWLKIWRLFVALENHNVTGIPKPKLLYCNVECK